MTAPSKRVLAVVAVFLVVPLLPLSMYYLMSSVEYDPLYFSRNFVCYVGSEDINLTVGEGELGVVVWAYDAYIFKNGGVVAINSPYLEPGNYFVTGTSAMYYKICVISNYKEVIGRYVTTRKYAGYLIGLYAFFPLITVIFVVVVSEMLPPKEVRLAKVLVGLLFVTTIVTFLILLPQANMLFGVVLSGGIDAFEVGKIYLYSRGSGESVASSATPFIDGVSFSNGTLYLGINNPTNDVFIIRKLYLLVNRTEIGIGINRLIEPGSNVVEVALNVTGGREIYVLRVTFTRR